MGLNEGILICIIVNAQNAYVTLVNAGKEKMNRTEVYNQLVIDEGVKYEIYRDHLGYPTLGVGHLITEFDEEKDMPIGTSISEKTVIACFEKDLDVAINECRILYEPYFQDFPGEVQEILVNMMFNMGRPRLSQFRNFRIALERNRWKEAAAEGRNSRWYKQVTNRAERLMTRMENVS